ncbi:MAG: hypothetical protein RSB69_04335 [Odoribacter sp.]
MLNDERINFSSQGKQLYIDDFKSSLEGLNKSNRWAQLGDTLPWYEIEILYNKRLNNGKRGAGNKPARTSTYSMTAARLSTVTLINCASVSRWYIPLPIINLPVLESSIKKCENNLQKSSAKQ